MSKFKKTIQLSYFLIPLLLTGCTNTLYQADIDFITSEGKARKASLYWTKTEQLIGETKAESIKLRAACSTRVISFSQTETGILFRSTAEMDHFPENPNPVPENTVCGKIESHSVLTNITSGALSLSIKCEAVTDEFSFNFGLFSSAYLPAKNSPYQFLVTETSQWSFFGTSLSTPPPDCQ